VQVQVRVQVRVQVQVQVLLIPPVVDAVDVVARPTQAAEADVAAAQCRTGANTCIMTTTATSTSR